MFEFIFILLTLTINTLTIIRQHLKKEDPLGFDTTNGCQKRQDKKSGCKKNNSQ